MSPELFLRPLSYKEAVLLMNEGRILRAIPPDYSGGQVLLHIIGYSILPAGFVYEKSHGTVMYYSRGEESRGVVAVKHSDEERFRILEMGRVLGECFIAAMTLEEFNQLQHSTL